MQETIRAVQRALELMQLMNRRESWTLQELSAASGLPKTTVFRLLHTLEASGYVHKPRDCMGLYRLTSKTRLLSAGLTETTRFADVADPIVIAATRTLDWPVSFALPDGPFMRVVCCGVPYCRKHAARSTSIGARLCMFSSALGKAYLSHCTAEAVDALRRDAATHHPNVPSLGELLIAAEHNRALGYGVRLASPSDVTAAVAVPVLVADRVLGAVSCSTFPNTLSGTFIRAVLDGLKAAAEQVSEACAGCREAASDSAMPKLAA